MQGTWAVSSPPQGERLVILLSWLGQGGELGSRITGVTPRSSLLQGTSVKSVPSKPTLSRGDKDGRRRNCRERAAKPSRQPLDVLVLARVHAVSNGTSRFTSAVEGWTSLFNN